MLKIASKLNKILKNKTNGIHFFGKKRPFYKNSKTWFQVDKIRLKIYWNQDFPLQGNNLSNILNWTNKIIRPNRKNNQISNCLLKVILWWHILTYIRVVKTLSYHLSNDQFCGGL